MIRITITAEAFAAIASTLPFGSTAFEPELSPTGERFIWLEPRFIDRLAALRDPGESYSDVILRLAGRNGTGIDLTSEKLMPDEYSYNVEQCDVSVERRSALEQFRAKRRVWTSWLATDEHHAIWSTRTRWFGRTLRSRREWGSP